MMSGKSCFKPSWPLMRKDITRFWPIWASYLAIWTLILPVRLVHIFRSSSGVEALARQSESARQLILSSAQMTGVLLAFAYGLICAMAVWSYLTAARSVSLYHALPVTRESAFVSHWLTGLSFTVVPSGIIALLTWLCAAACGSPGLGRVVLYWLGAVCLQQLLFFCIGTFTAMLTGSLPGLAALYPMLNLAVYICEVLVDSTAVLFMRGVNDISPRLTVLSPVVQLVSLGNAYWDPALSSPFEGLQYPLLLCYAGAALVLSALALLLYRKRASESAGDMVALPLLRPVFQVCCALGCSLILGWFFWVLLFQQAEAWVSLLCSLLLGGMIGWFAAAMLLKKSFRVFVKKQWLGLIAFSLAICIAVLLLVLDVFGIVSRVPEPSQLRSAQLRSGGVTVQLTEEESFSQLTALHRALLQEPEGSGSKYDQWVYISYTLNDGTEVSRSYTFEAGENDLQRADSLVAQLARLLKNPQAAADALLPENRVFHNMEFSLAEGADENWKLHSEHGDSEALDWAVITDEKQISALRDALRQDILEHFLNGWAPDWQQETPVMRIYLFSDVGVYSLNAHAESELAETLPLLVELGYLEGAEIHE